MTVSIDDINDGSVIMVRGSWGREAPVRATVIDIDTEGKNGKPVISYLRQDGEEKWAYMNQVTQVVYA